MIRYAHSGMPHPYPLSEMQDPALQELLYGELVHLQSRPVLHFERRFQQHRFQQHRGGRSGIEQEEERWPTIVS